MIPIIKSTFPGTLEFNIDSLTEEYCRSLAARQPKTHEICLPASASMTRSGNKCFHCYWHEVAWKMLTFLCLQNVCLNNWNVWTLCINISKQLSSVKISTYLHFEFHDDEIRQVNECTGVIREFKNNVKSESSNCSRWNEACTETRTNKASRLLNPCCSLAAW